MTTSENFKIWLETIYVSEKTHKPLTSGTQYVTGLKALNKKFDLPNDGIFDENVNLQHIRNLIDKPENFHKDYSSHFNAFLKFRDYYLERSNNNKKALQRQNDVFKKQQVEISAIETTIKYFENLDYIVISKETDNLGWDLEATNLNETLYLEVKGLSGNISTIELTPNEYKNSKSQNNKYKICIVTNALKNPILDIFSFDMKINSWINDKNQILEIEEKIGAIMRKK